MKKLTDPNKTGNQIKDEAWQKNNMKNYDIFNGDADGLISLHQYRLQFPRKSELITGVKRDVKLLRHLVDITDASLVGV